MSNEFTWTCPQCGRAVPRRLEACRCGQKRAVAETPPPAPPRPAAPIVPAAQPPAPAAASGHKVILIAAGVVAAALVVAATVLAVAWIRTKQIQTPASSQALAAAAPAVTLSASAPSAPVALEPDADFVVPTLAELRVAPAEDQPEPMSVEEVVTRALPAVVKVETREGIGSGFFVAADTLLTNAHVVGMEKAVTLKLSDGRKKTAKVDDVWREVDLAVLKIDLVDLDQVVLPIAKPEDIKIGAEVIAIGSPLGLQNTVTRGIISGMRMYIYDRITPQGMEVVQTDAAINPGNSGGPLIDRYGRVVGVNTLKLAGDAERLGFAVQMHYARRLLGGEFALKPAGDRRLETALKKYEEMVARLAQRADEVDGRWASFRPQCFKSAAQQARPREWFALWEGPTPALSDAAACERGRDYFLGWAKLAHDALYEYDADAREAAVQPAFLRAVRRKYNVAWPGWEK